MEEKNGIIIYQTEDGQTAVDVRMENETVWLTQAQMTELFQTDRTVIVRHIKNIYKSGELEEKLTCTKMHKFDWKEKEPLLVKYHITIKI